MQNNAFLGRPSSLAEERHSLLGLIPAARAHFPVKKIGLVYGGERQQQPKKISGQFRWVSAPQETISTNMSTFPALTDQQTFLPCSSNRSDQLPLLPHTDLQQ